jgi:hypothetical protein
MLKSVYDRMVPPVTFVSESLSGITTPLSSLKKVAWGAVSLITSPIAFVSSPFHGWAQAAHGTAQLITGTFSAATHVASAGQTAAKLIQQKPVTLKEGTNLSVMATVVTGAALAALNPALVGATAMYLATSKFVIIPFAIAWGLL